MFAKFLQNTLGYQTAIEFASPAQPVQACHAQRILELEMECQSSSATPSLVAELVSLYAEAYEFFEKKGSEKCMVYQKRMHQFLAKESIDTLMRGQKGHLVVAKEIVDRKTQHAIYTSKDDAKRIIDKSLKKAEKDRKRISRQLKNQDQKLEARIQRRKSMSNKSSRAENEDTCEDLFGKKLGGPNCNLVFQQLNGRNNKRVFI